MRVLSKRFWAKLIGSFIIAFALLFSGLRFATIFWSPSSTQITSWLSHQLPYPIQFQNLKLEWDNFDPTVILSNVVIQPESNQQPIHFAQVKISLSLWHLMTNDFQIESLVLKQGNFSIWGNQQGLGITGFPLASVKFDSTQSGRLPIKHLRLVDCQVNLQLPNQKWALQGVELSFHHRLTTHLSFEAGLADQNKRYHLEANVKPTFDGWHLTGHQAFVDAQDVVSEPLSFELTESTQSKSTQWQFAISKFEIEPWLARVKALNVLPDETMAKLNQYHPKGLAQYIQVNLGYRDNQFKIDHVQAQLKNIHVEDQSKHWAVNNINGTMVFEHDKGLLSLDGRHTLVKIPSWFEKDLALHQLQAKIFWHQEEHATQIEIKSLNFNLAQTPFELSGQTVLIADQQPEVELAFHLGAMSIQQLKTLMPYQKMDPSLNKWLAHAFEHGNINYADGVFRGRFADFPFDQHQGVFELIAQVEDVNLHYVDEWPNLEHLTANLRFHNRSLDIDVEHAKINGDDSVQAHALIPDLGTHWPMLVVDADVESTLETGVEVIKNSPLKTIAKTFEPMSLQGPMKLALGLHVPLAKDCPTPIQVRGKIDLHDGIVSIKQYAHPIQSLKGTVLFTESKLQADLLQGRFLNNPINFKLSQAEANPQQLQIDAQGHINLDEIAEEMNLPSNYVGGASQFDATLRCSAKDMSELQFNVSSSLQGVTIDAFGIVQKKADETKALDLAVIRESNELMHTVVKLGDDLHLNGSWDPASKQWSIDLTGTQISGNMVLPLSNDDKPRSIKLTKLSLPAQTDKTEFKPTQAPDPHPIDIQIEDFKYGEKTIKRLKARLEPAVKGYAIPLFKCQIGGSEVSVAANWDYLATVPKMSAKGEILTPNAGDLMKYFGYDDMIQKAKGKVEFNLDWEGGPTNINKSTLNGFAEFNLQKGAIKGVNPAIGRVLSLLNMDNVKKRLSFDFSDITKNSFSFNELTGKCQFGKGKVSTNNFVLNGPSAKITATGQADLTSQLVDAEMIVMPNVTGSLPVAAAVAVGNPAVGAAIWVVDKFFGSKIQQIHRFHYKVAGTLKSPQVEELPTVRIGKR